MYGSCWWYYSKWKIFDTKLSTSLFLSPEEDLEKVQNESGDTTYKLWNVGKPFIVD
jgi:hypothetical protein